MTIDEKTTIGVRILVPAEVDEGERASFEKALVDFVLGADRVREELHPALQEQGVDVKHLALLSRRPRIGVCPTPEAHEFVPSAELARVARERGIDLTGGGRVLISFDYDAYADGSAPEDQLEIAMSLPEGLGEDEGTVRDVVVALFGDCQLAPAAQAYLRAHGVELEEIAAANSHQLDGGEIPATTRAATDVERILSERGFSTARRGSFNVASIRDVKSIGGDEVGITWSKATCC